MSRDWTSSPDRRLPNMRPSLRRRLRPRRGQPCHPSVDVAGIASPRAFGVIKLDNRVGRPADRRRELTGFLASVGQGTKQSDCHGDGQPPPHPLRVLQHDSHSLVQAGPRGTITKTPSARGARTVRRGLQAPAGEWCLVVLAHRPGFALWCSVCSLHRSLQGSHSETPFILRCIHFPPFGDWQNDEHRGMILPPSFCQELCSSLPPSQGSNNNAKSATERAHDFLQKSENAKKTDLGVHFNRHSSSPFLSWQNHGGRMMKMSVLRRLSILRTAFPTS